MPVTKGLPQMPYLQQSKGEGAWLSMPDYRPASRRGSLAQYAGLQACIPAPTELD